MAAEMCENHPFELGDDWCADCGRAYCNECTVYAFGPKRPPLCRACAIARSGVRKHAARAPVASRRAIRREAKARRRADKQRDKITAEAPSYAPEGAPAAAPEPADAPEPEPVLEPVAAYAAQPAMAPPAAAVAAAPPPPDLPPPPVPGTSVLDDLPYATDDEPELHEVRPSFEGRLTRRRL